MPQSARPGNRADWAGVSMIVCVAVESDPGGQPSPLGSAGSAR